MKRSPLKRKRTTKRRTLTARCIGRGCNNPQRVGSWCRRHAVIECDRLARARCLEDNESCTGPGPHRGGLQWSHHLSRRFYRTRWDPNNATAHCAGCHLRFTEHSALHTEWIIEHIGEAEYERLKDVAYGPKIEPGLRAHPDVVHDSEIEDWLNQLREAA